MKFQTSPIGIILQSITAIFIVTALTYYIALAMPSIFLLTPTAMNFALLGVMGIAAGICGVFDYLLTSGPYGAVLGAITSPFTGLYMSIVYAIPFFIAIACGAPAFITTSYLSWSAANISILTYSALSFLTGIIFLACNVGDISIDSSEFNGGVQLKSFNTQRSQTYREGYNLLI